MPDSGTHLPIHEWKLSNKPHPSQITHICDECARTEFQRNGNSCTQMNFRWQRVEMKLATTVSGALWGELQLHKSSLIRKKGIQADEPITG